MGKIYGGMLILENWKVSRFGAVARPGGKVGLRGSGAVQSACTSISMVFT